MSEHQHTVTFVLDSTSIGPFPLAEWVTIEINDRPVVAIDGYYYFEEPTEDPTFDHVTEPHLNLGWWGRKGDTGQADWLPFAHLIPENLIDPEAQPRKFSVDDGDLEDVGVRYCLEHHGLIEADVGDGPCDNARSEAVEDPRAKVADCRPVPLYVNPADDPAETTDNPSEGSEDR